MDEGFFERRRQIRLITSYLIPPVMAVYGVYCAIKMDFRLGSQVEVTGPLAILCGLGFAALGFGLFIALSYRDMWLRGGRPED